MITFTLANGAALTLRTSGTEPKIKYYADLKVAAATECVWVLTLCLSLLYISSSLSV